MLNGVRIAGSVGVIVALSEFPEIPPLASSSVPVWHPDVTAFQSEDRMTIRLPIGGGVTRELTLFDSDAVWWCRCDGSAAELALAQMHMLETGCSVAAARRRIFSFLQPLYRAGVLVRHTPQSITHVYSREVESSLLQMEHQLWERPTS